MKYTSASSICILTNKDGHGRSGTVVAMVRCTKSEDVAKVLMQIPEEERKDATGYNLLYSVIEQDNAITPAVRKEMDDIKAAAIADGTFMKAPNGADTNLTEEQ